MRNEERAGKRHLGERERKGTRETALLQAVLGMRLVVPDLEGAWSAVASTFILSAQLRRCR